MTYINGPLTHLSTLSPSKNTVHQYDPHQSSHFESPHCFDGSSPPPPVAVPPQCCLLYPCPPLSTIVHGRYEPLRPPFVTALVYCLHHRQSTRCHLRHNPPLIVVWCPDVQAWVIPVFSSLRSLVSVHSALSFLIAAKDVTFLSVTKTQALLISARG